MTVAEMARLINVEGTLSVDGLAFGVRIVDVRMRFGTLDVQVVPLNGHGVKWVESGRVAFDRAALSVA